MAIHSSYGDNRTSIDNSKIDVKTDDKHKLSETTMNSGQHIYIYFVLL